MDMDAPAGAAPDQSLRIPPLTGRHVYLRPLIPEDYRALRATEITGQLAVRGRFRGATPSPEQWANALWQSVLAQFVVARTNDNRLIGLIMAHRANFTDGHAYITAESFTEGGRSPLMVLGSALFVDYVFRCWNFHKLYFETAEYNLAQVNSGVGRIFEVEARMRDHISYDGQRWEQLVLAIYRDRWSEESARVLAAELPRPARVARIRFQSAHTPDAT